MRICVALIALLSLFMGAAAADSENSPSKHPSSTVSAGQGPSSVAIDPNGKYAYVANEEAWTVSVFTINPDTGNLSAQSTVSLDGYGDPVYISVDPTGKFVYVATFQDHSYISAFRINPNTGSLIAVKRVETETQPASIAVHPSGKFAYLVHFFGISVFTVSTVTGKLALRTNVKFPGERPNSVAVDPHGKFAYVTGGNSANVVAYAINPVTGSLTAKGSVVAGNNPMQVVVHPTGKFVYVASEDDTVSMYAANQVTGALTSLGNANTTWPARSLVVHPNGKFLYVATSAGSGVNNLHKSNTVQIFGIDQDTGALTNIGSVEAGEAPSSVAIHPNGKFLYVTNRKSNDVSMYAINPATGALSVPGQ